MEKYYNKQLFECKNFFKRMNLIKETVDQDEDEYYDEDPPIKPGTYTLWRGSRNSNQNAALGIYANGIHYSTDIHTAMEFGDPTAFNVTLKNPKVIDNLEEIKNFGNNPYTVTKNLMEQGFDSLVIKHKHIIQSLYDEPDNEYIEHEVIVLNNNIR